MENRKFIVIVVFICLGITLAGVTIGYNLGKQRDSRDSQRLDELRRQTRTAIGIVKQLDSGLGDVQAGLTYIGSNLVGDAGDIRIVAQRLYNIASKVKEMEDSLDSLRRNSSSFLGDYGDSSDSLESDSFISK